MQPACSGRRSASLASYLTSADGMTSCARPALSRGCWRSTPRRSLLLLKGSRKPLLQAKVRLKVQQVSRNYHRNTLGLSRACFPFSHFLRCHVVLRLLSSLLLLSLLFLHYPVLCMHSRSQHTLCCVTNKMMRAFRKLRLYLFKNASTVLAPA